MSETSRNLLVYKYICKVPKQIYNPNLCFLFKYLNDKNCLFYDKNFSTEIIEPKDGHTESSRNIVTYIIIFLNTLSKFITSKWCFLVKYLNYENLYHSIRSVIRFVF